jgi:hypothetical protein
MDKAFIKIQKELMKPKEEEEKEMDINFPSVDKSPWIDIVPYTEPSEYEKKMLVGTLNPKELLETENKEEPMEVDKTKILIQMSKVMSLKDCGYHILSNPSLMSRKEKERIKDKMKYYLTEIEQEDLTEQFNKLCMTDLFNDTADYSKFTVNPNAV